MGWKVFPPVRHLQYTLSDSSFPNMCAAARLCRSWAGQNAWVVQDEVDMHCFEDPESSNERSILDSVPHSEVHTSSGLRSRSAIQSSLHLRRVGCTRHQTIEIKFHWADSFALLEESENRKNDLVIAAAFLDLFDCADVLPGILKSLSPAGPKLFYFPLNFDGITFWHPLEPNDRIIESAYHAAMGPGKTSSLPRCMTGRSVITELLRLNAQLDEIGSALWAVQPRCGAYPEDEAYFLECLLLFVKDTLLQNPESNNKDLVNE
mmetsp:Transcript_18266/g.38150  ORF Transcript_18266/g.38150 Transcript_18266/m.38150 type:complete len:263 (-) Transcript_18266:994-1782(-)